MEENQPLRPVPLPITDVARREIHLANDHVQKVCAGLHTLQQNKTLCDVTIKVGDESFEAHKAVLASSSEFFRSMFTSGFQESHASEARITGTPQSFKILLDFSYSGKLVVDPDDTTTLMNVLKMAHYLQYTSVVKPCEEKILPNVQQCSMKDVFKMLSECDVFGLQKLKTMCLRSVAQDFNGSDDFLQCMTSDLIVQAMKHTDFNIMDEKQVFDIIVAWLKRDWEARKEFAPQLLQEVRLGAVPSAHLTVTFLQMPELNAIPECQEMLVGVMQIHDSMQPNDPPLSVSHPALFRPRSMVTTFVRLFPNGGPYLFFDVKKGDWQQLTRLPELPRRDFHYKIDTCVVAKNQLALYVARGTESARPSPRRQPQHSLPLLYPQFLSLDMVKKKWTVLASMMHRREGGCLVRFGKNQIYAIGGFDREVGIKECEVYAIDENRWREIAPMPYLMRKVGPNSAVAYGNKILACGEVMDEDETEDNILHLKLMMYNPTLNTWLVLRTWRHNIQNLPDLDPPDYATGLVIDNSKCYRIIGGGNAGFDVREVIIDPGTYQYTGAQTHRQEAYSIPDVLKPLVFCINQNVYVFCGSGYYKSNIPYTDISTNVQYLQNLGIKSKACVARFTFDTALWV